jgi:hypothetical protein
MNYGNDDAVMRPNFPNILIIQYSDIPIHCFLAGYVSIL